MRQVAGIAVLMWLAVLAHHRAQAWESNTTLWTAAVSVTPENPAPWLWLAVAEWRAGHAEPAHIALERAHQTSAARWHHPQDPVTTRLWFWTDTFAGSSLFVGLRPSSIPRF